MAAVMQAPIDFLVRMVDRTARFGIVGFLSVAIYFAFMYLLRGIIAHTGLLAAVCYGLSMVANFLMQSQFTFRSPLREAGIMRRYLMMHGLALALNSLAVMVLVDGFALPLFIAQAYVTLFLVLFTFLMSQFWVFRT
jgi:putative flippase GtrA